MSVFNGTDVLIFDADTGEPIALQRGVNFSIQDNGIDITTKSSGGFTELLPGLRSCTITGDSLVDFQATQGVSELFDYYENRTLVMFDVSSPNESEVYFRAEGYIESLEANAGTEDVSAYTFTLTGTGQFESLAS